MTQAFYQRLLPPPQNWLYQKFLQAVIYPSVWVAGAIASLVPFVQTTLGLPFSWAAVALIFAAALLPYNLDRVADSFVQKIPDRQAQSFFRQPGVLLILLAAAIATGILLYQAPIAVRWVSLAGLLPLLYGLPLLPLRLGEQWRWYRVKDIPGAKAWIVCGTIAYAVVAVPLAYAGQPLSGSAVITAMFLLIFVGSNSHAFDIRDIESDREKGVSTLPVMVGVGGTRITLTTLNIAALALLASGWILGWAGPGAAIAIPLTLITLTYIWTLNPQTPRNAYNIWIDGVLYLPALLTWMISGLGS